jgi:hypothetical protein
MIESPTNKALLIVALSLIALWSMYSGDKVTLATIVGAFIMFLKQD